LVVIASGSDGDDAKLSDELVAQCGRPGFIHVHEWTQGDTLVSDNRCLIHTALERSLASGACFASAFLGMTVLSSPRTPVLSSRAQQGTFHFNDELHWPAQIKHPRTLNATPAK